MSSRHSAPMNETRARPPVDMLGKMFGRAYTTTRFGGGGHQRRSNIARLLEHLASPETLVVPSGRIVEIERLLLSALFVGLNVAHLAAVCAFARCAGASLGGRLRGAVSVCAANIQAGAFLKHLLLLLALVPSFFVLLETLLFFLRPVVVKWLDIIRKD